MNKIFNPRPQLRIDPLPCQFTIGKHKIKIVNKKFDFDNYYFKTKKLMNRFLFACNDTCDFVLFNQREQVFLV